MPKLDPADPILQAAACHVAGALAALDFEVSAEAIVARVGAANGELPDLPPTALRRMLCIEAAIVGCHLACPHHPGTPAHALGLRPVPGWGWGAGERLMEELDEAVDPHR